MRSRPSLRSLPLIALMSLAVAGSGCDLLKKATATTIVSGLILTSPEVQLANNFTVPSETAATSWVGSRASATSTEEPTPITGATVSTTFGTTTVALPEQMGQPGVYLAESVSNMSLSYVEGQSYAFKAVLPDGTSHSGAVNAPPKLSADSITYSPALSDFSGDPTHLVKSHPKATDLTISWDKSHGPYAYLTVLRADQAHPDQPQQIYDTRPKTAGDVLRLIAGNPPTSVTVPASALDTDGVYAVVLVTLAKGGPTDNLTFLGSPFLAGSGAVTFLAIGMVTLH